jgi:hypothetical protein
MVPRVTFGTLRQVDDRSSSIALFLSLERFRDYFGRKEIERWGFPREKTTKRPVASVDTQCKSRSNRRIWIGNRDFVLPAVVAVGGSEANFS